MNSFLPCTSRELNLDVVLLNGQSFRWHKVEDESATTAFIGVTRNRVWKIWRENPHGINYTVLGKFSEAHKSDMSDTEALQDFFQTNVDINQLYEEWSNKDEHFRKIVELNGTLLEGIRILNLGPLEALFTFICTANNNIKRITSMVNRLCKEYGESLEVDSITYYDFPNVERLHSYVSTMETTLRNAGFGYRASYITDAVKKLIELGGEKWLFSMIDQPYESVKQKLLQLPGVGPKVADCVCLMGLQKHQVVPIDTHVFQITTSLYMPQFKGKKSVTKVMHEEIGKFYSEYFGDHAGWAQTVLFSAQLKQFGAETTVGRRKVMHETRTEVITKKQRK